MAENRAAAAADGFTRGRRGRKMAAMTTCHGKTFGPLAPLSREALAHSLAETIASAPTPDALWVFAYGSLIWSPCFAPAATIPGTLQGHHRAFNIWTIHSRGTPETPGLALGLEPGGACQGVLFRIAAESRNRDLESIWRREMYSGLYRPCWLPVNCAGGVQHAICFIADTTHPQYAGEIPSESAATIIARAEGVSGPCRDYLRDLLRALAAHGIREPGLDALAALVRTRGQD